MVDLPGETDLRQRGHGAVRPAEGHAPPRSQGNATSITKTLKKNLDVNCIHRIKIKFASLSLFVFVFPSLSYPSLSLYI